MRPVKLTILKYQCGNINKLNMLCHLFIEFTGLDFCKHHQSSQLESLCLFYGSPPLNLPDLSFIYVVILSEQSRRRLCCSQCTATAASLPKANAAHFGMGLSVFCLCQSASNHKHCFITPLKNPARRAGGRKPEAFGTDFWGGFERKLQKKVHNGSENSENKKKYGVV